VADVPSLTPPKETKKKKLNMGIKHCLGPKGRALKALIREEQLEGISPGIYYPPLYDLKAGAVLYAYILQASYIKIILTNLPDTMEDHCDHVVCVVS
jgi:hypothetical protein